MHSPQMKPGLYAEPPRSCHAILGHPHQTPQSAHCCEQNLVEPSAHINGGSQNSLDGVQVIPATSQTGL